MLFRFILLRIGPMMILYLLKDRKKLKLAAYGGVMCWGISLIVAILEIFKQEHWKSIFLLLLSMFPQYLFYVFAYWLIIRCVRSAWSKRVWYRIFFVSFACVLCGIFVETYINPMILEFFVKKILRFF
mgnify:CR=1 FL=1